jgi:glycosyltransferase involved in cell wall biosynthesis
MAGLKILNIVPTPFFADRGCHMRILGEVKALDNCGFTNIICTYHNGRDLEGLDIRRIINIPWYRKLEAGPSWHKFYIDMLLFFKAASVYLRERPDIIYGHLHEGAFVGGLIKYLVTFGRAKVAFDVQGSLTNELDSYNWLKNNRFFRKAFFMLEKMICRMPDFFICSSESNGEIIRNRFRIDAQKIRVVIDGVHTDYFNVEPEADLKEKIGIPPDKPVVIFTGALLASKGIDNLTASIPLVLKEVPQAQFLIVGYPVDATSKEVGRLGVSGNTHFTGMVDYYELPKYLKISDIALEPKIDVAGEASGKVINYMGAGLPVVCFDSLNNRRFLKDGGIYAQDNSIEDFAAKIVWAIKNPEEAQKLGRLNEKRVEEVFSWNSSIKATVEAFEMLALKNKP